MNKRFGLAAAALAAITILSSGCGVDEVTPPAAVGVTGTPSTVQVQLSSSSIANGGTANVTATVTDNLARVVPNVSVSFSVISATAGSFNPTSATTNASGQATSVFTAGAAVNSTATIRATVTLGTSTISGSAQITIGTPPRVPTSVVVSLTPSSIANGGSTSVSATVTDASGGIPGYTVTFSSSVSGAGTFTSVTTTGACPGATCGVATATFTAATPAGDNTLTDITATAGTVSNSATLTIGTPPPPTPASMTLTINPQSISISSQTTVSVSLLDATGGPAYNNSVTLTIIAGTTLGSFSPMPSSVLTTTLTTNSSGIASATFYAGSSSGTVTIEATAGSLPTKNASLIITSNPDHISLSAVSSSLVNGQTTNVTADVRNVLNQAVSDGTLVTFTMTYSGAAPGSLSSATAYTVYDPITGGGLAQVTFTADASNTGPVFITASAGTATSNQQVISVSAAQAGSLEFVSVTPSSGVINIYGAGTSDATVKFRVLSTTGSPLSGISVNFTLYGPTGAYLDTLDATPRTSSGSTNGSGEVTTILHAGSVAGPVRIVATTTVSGLSTSSGNISIGGGVPSDRWFSVAVSRFNLDGLGCNGVESTISAYIADRFGNYNILQGTSVSFATDSGAIDTSNITDATGYTTAVYRTQDPRPTDVAPAAWETALGLSYVDGTRTRNPRDGWVTVLVSTTGEEHFVDQNADGVYILADDGTNFTDIPEPFIDSDDDGSHDTGELFFDWPGGATGVPGATAGTHNDVNGVWDARIPIFRNVTLVFTGPPHFSSNTTRMVDSLGGTGPVTIPAGGAATLYLYLSDINLNTPIGGTKITASSSKTEAKVEITSGYDTIPDGLSYGPSLIGITVTNNNTTGTPMVAPISATIEWPGKCGTITTKISYPGTVTLQ